MTEKKFLLEFVKLQKKICLFNLNKYKVFRKFLTSTSEKK